MTEHTKIQTATSHTITTIKLAHVPNPTVATQKNIQKIQTWLNNVNRKKNIR
jgi:hypothetical protein